MGAAGGRARSAREPRIIMCLDGPLLPIDGREVGKSRFCLPSRCEKPGRFEAGRATARSNVTSVPNFLVRCGTRTSQTSGMD